MTTIAYRDGVLAVDRQCTDGGVKSVTDCKLVYLKKERAAIAICGALTFGMAFIDWYSGDRAEPLIFNTSAGTINQFAALVVHRVPQLTACGSNRPYSNELFYYGVGVYPLPLSETDYHAEGSGTEVALGAMHMGASAIRAIKAANHHLNDSGYGVRWIDMKQPLPEIEVDHD